MASSPKPPAASNSTVVPPYVPYRSFRNFLDSLAQSIPARIDRSVMSSMSGALQSQLMTALRYLNLVSATGTPSPLLTKLVTSEGAERVQNMRAMLKMSYPFLFEGFDLKTATPRMVEEKFSEMGASGGTLDKCMLFFLAAAKDAEVEVSPHLRTPRGSRVSRTRVSSRSRLPVSIDDAAIENGSDTNELTWAQMLLSKFPSFDPNWPDDVKTKWFDAFDKLMKQGPQ